MTLVSEDAAHNSLQMSYSRDLTDVSETRDLTDVSETRDLTDVSEDAAQNYLQMWLWWVSMKVDDADDGYAADYFDESWWWW